MTSTLQFSKGLTAKKLRQVIEINHYYIVRNSEGAYNVYDSCNIILPGQQRFIDSNLFEFDAQPFIDFYNDWKEKKAQEAAAAKEAARLAEEKRIADLRERIERCETPKELADEFKLSMVEIAGHWSDLYEGRSTYGFMISDREEFEIMELAIEIHSAEGEYGEAKHRAGEHHQTFSSIWGSMDGYQEACKRHFSGDKYFYRSQEVDADNFMERIKDAEDMDLIQELVKEYQELEAGYYDCNGNLEISEEELESPDFTGYSEDVYSYNFCFRINNKYSWTADEEETEDEE